jgi:hypothetical protein
MPPITAPAIRPAEGPEEVPGMDGSEDVGEDSMDCTDVAEAELDCILGVGVGTAIHALETYADLELGRLLCWLEATLALIIELGASDVLETYAIIELRISPCFFTRTCCFFSTPDSDGRIIAAFECPGTTLEDSTFVNDIGRIPKLLVLLPTASCLGTIEHSITQGSTMVQA